MAENTVRCFIAIDLPEEVRKNFYETILSAKTGINGFRPSEPQNIHLTLKFLGYISGEILEKIKNSLDETVKDLTKFDMTFGEIGAFPSFSSPRILWIAPEKGLEQIRQIKERLDSQLSMIGIEKDEKDFKAHITLARLNYIKKGKTDFEKIFSNIKIDATPDISVEALHLYQSNLTSNGPIYTKLYSANVK